mmetsp:Transcript_34409/g.102212  ORF Transcript_34409/g.102212 Transcript_34409/m.102212 type:complete len:496 (-) Transcript_34409:77-1564(-)
MTFDGLGCPQKPPEPFSHRACTWSTDPTAYRQLQEIAYTNHEGAGLVSTCLLMLTYPMVVCFHQLMAEQSARWLHPRAACLVSEYGAAVLPLAIGFSTPHTGWLQLANLLLVCSALCASSAEGLAWLPMVTRMQATRVVRKEGVYVHRGGAFTHIDEDKKRLRFVAEYRAVVMITTMIVILAVDFPAIFPREHAKTEAYGYSLMDLGTGCVICASAVCSHAARGVTQGRRASATLKRLLSLWPVIVIGMARFVVLWGIDYHVPTSEYGVHWNFFFTIAVVAMVSTAADLGPRGSAAAGATILMLYQAYLSLLGGAEYILHAPRSGFFSANREGILGCAGYLGIHWVSVALGSLCSGPAQQDSRGIARRLLVIAAAGVGGAWLLDLAGLPASHRLVNLTYCVLIVGVDALVLGLLAFEDLYWPWQRRPLPLVYGGVQDSMLMAFLLANLLTGAVNVSMQPLLMPWWAALAVISAYSFVWSVLLGFLHSRGVVLKFW